MRALRLPALHPFGLLIHQPVPRLACLFAPGPPQAGAGPDPLFRPVVRVPAIMRGQCGASQVPRRAIPWLCGRSLTPDDPLRLANRGASGAAPAIIRTKASTLRISRLNSVASPPAVYASRHLLPDAMPHSLPAGGLRLCRAGVEPAGSRCKVSAHSHPPCQGFPWRTIIPNYFDGSLPFGVPYIREGCATLPDIGSGRCYSPQRRSRSARFPKSALSWAPFTRVCWTFS